ncbi:SCO0930 family lipoprotein [Streptomyces zingiberis]|uniref:Lipoprotein n=1 Tax=Streptomyces zingiberis TaxID=2053010 RepID=A0ABX1BT15_9ACTN|nr:SCO0930 family lipoprotein [Streptomyces zingiberis]NJQ00233.1 hypothetical protein [Streptomyces zingiberis]
MRKWQGASVAVTAVAMMLMTSCAQDPGGAGATQPAGQPGAVTPQDPAGGAGQNSAPPAGGAGQGAQKAKPAGQLTIGDSEELGQVLTDSAGFTLYRFEKDKASPPQATCEGDCAKAWPPVPAADVSSTAGIDEALLGEVSRADGTKQLTVGGWPMYRYAKDTEPWQTNGQGMGGTWYAAAPDGKKAAAGGSGGGAGGKPEGSAPAGGAQESRNLPAVSTVQDADLGTIIRDGKGRTLYAFTKDSRWPMKSNCAGKCEELWKPVGAVDLKDVKGITPKLLTTFKRDDGTEQLSIDCWPLYTYTGDEKAGDTNGQGVGGTWFTVSPKGKLIKG